MIKKRTVISIGVVAIVVFLVGLKFAVFSYGITRKQWDGRMTRLFARVTGFPAGKVDGHKATYTDYLAQIDAQKVYLQTEDARSRQLPREVNAETSKAAYSQIMQIAALEALADEYQVAISDLDINRGFDDFVAQSGTSTSPGEIDAFLKESFGWTREEFKRFFIRPGVMSQALRTKMPGKTEEEKGQALGQKIDERLLKDDVKKYLLFPS